MSHTFKPIKILHTADWHLGKKLQHFSRHEEQILVMREICEIAEARQVDLVIVAGDLFDTFNPPAESQELLYSTLHRLANGGKRPVIAIAGNHDMPERIEAPDSLALNCGIIFAGFPHTQVKTITSEGFTITKSEPGFIELMLPEFEFPVRVLMTPYANEIRLKQALDKTDSEEDLRNLLQTHWKQLTHNYCDNCGVNLLVAHLYMMKKDGARESEPEGEKSVLHIGGAQEIYTVQIPQQIQYTALGHLHRYQIVEGHTSPVVYSSSPLAYSFAEADQTKYVVEISLQPGVPASMQAIKLCAGMPLLRCRHNNVTEALAWLAQNQNAYVELTLVTDTYVDGETRRKLTQSHAYIVDIIPELSKPNDETQADDPLQMQQQLSIQELFKAYFKHEYKQEPSASMLDLFARVLGEEELP